MMLEVWNWTQIQRSQQWFTNSNWLVTKIKIYRVKTKMSKPIMLSSSSSWTSSLATQKSNFIPINNKPPAAVSEHIYTFLVGMTSLCLHSCWKRSQSSRNNSNLFSPKSRTISIYPLIIFNLVFSVQSLIRLWLVLSGWSWSWTNKNKRLILSPFFRVAFEANNKSSPSLNLQTAAAAAAGSFISVLLCDF